MDGNGNGWCAGEAVPAEFFMKDKDLNAKQADKNAKKKKKKPKVSKIVLVVWSLHIEPSEAYWSFEGPAS